MRIGELADRSGRSISAIRYYEAEGLLERADRISGKRDFDDEALERLELISVGQTAGLSLPEIRALLDGNGENALADLAKRRLERVEVELENLQARPPVVGRPLGPSPMPTISFGPAAGLYF